MEDNFIDLSELNLSDEELFTVVDHDMLASEKITAPRYSYWKSVFRVFFKKKINIVILALLVVLVAFAYIYPLAIGYDAEVDPFINLTKQGELGFDPTHLSPLEAMDKFGASIHWILGSGASGESTFDSIWYGSSISLSLALICAAINMTVGVIIGAVWGFSKQVDIFMPLRRTPHAR